MTELMCENWKTTFRRASRWIQIRTDVVTPKHSLWDYADDGVLTHFRHGGRDYALGQFMRFNVGPIDTDMNFILEDGTVLVAYDATEWYRPLCMEIDEFGEYVRLYEEVPVNRDMVNYTRIAGRN